MSTETRRTAQLHPARHPASPRSRATEDRVPTAATFDRTAVAAVRSLVASSPGGTPARLLPATRPETVLLALQRTVGNAVVERLLRGSDRPAPDRQEVRRAPGGKKVAPPCPAGPAWAAAKRVAPNFVLATPAAKRSNTDPSTTNTDDPTMTGSAAVDCKARRWRFQLKTVESKGTIQLVYYTDDHYPAPTPSDDSGALSNVTKVNWKDIVKDLKDNKNGVPATWSAYRREALHEDYHWKVEWQGKVKTELKKVRTRSPSWAVGFDKAATAADAEADLAPKATTAFDAAMTRARTAYDALGDSPGDPPYVAQAPALVALAGRVKQHAKKQKW